MNNSQRIFINSFSSVNPSQITHENLIPYYGTGQVISLNKGGGEKGSKYRKGIFTKLGDIEISVWIELVEWLIDEENDQAYYGKIYEWYKMRALPNQTKIDIQKEALECYVRNLPEDKSWNDYIQFNQQYYPKRLNDPDLIDVITECCGMKCKATTEQIKVVYGEMPLIPCPICREFTHFKKVTE